MKNGKKVDRETEKLEDSGMAGINPALIDPTHVQPLVVYDKGFEPLGKVEPPGMEHWTHFADPQAEGSHLSTKGQKYPGELKTIGQIVTGCHEQINQCIMHCRMKFSYNRVQTKDGVKYYTANQHGVFSESNEGLYNEFLTNVGNCSQNCLSDQKCIHDLTFLHKKFSDTCYGLIGECAKPTNCGTYNNFNCMANCSGDLCYPLYRFVQDIKDFKVSVQSFEKNAKIRLSYDKHHITEQIKTAEIAATEAAKAKEQKKEKIELEASMVKHHIFNSGKKLKKELKHASEIVVNQTKKIIVSLKGKLGSAKQRLNIRITDIKRETQEKMLAAQETTKVMEKENQINAAEIKQTGEKVVKLIQANGDSQMDLAREQYKEAKEGLRNKSVALQKVISGRPSSKQNKSLLQSITLFVASL